MGTDLSARPQPALRTQPNLPDSHGPLTHINPSPSPCRASAGKHNRPGFPSFCSSGSMRSCGQWGGTKSESTQVTTRRRHICSSGSPVSWRRRPLRWHCCTIDSRHAALRGTPSRKTGTVIFSGENRDGYILGKPGRLYFRLRCLLLLLRPADGQGAEATAEGTLELADEGVAAQRAPAHRPTPKPGHLGLGLRLGQAVTPVAHLVDQLRPARQVKG